MSPALKTPVVLTVFNRVEKVKQVFAAIRQVKPTQLLIIANAPRLDRPDEAEQCAQVRAVVEQVDWDCDVLKRYSDVHLGIRQQLSTGFDWVFDTVEAAIILEDDCVPHSSFFFFCQELLERYRDDERVMSISGQNIQFGRHQVFHSYYFSRYFHSWGWASWRRAWQHMDVDMTCWPQVRDSGLLNQILADNRAVHYWKTIFQQTYEGKIQTWDYQWTLACWLQSGLTILPNRNLISNIGLAPGATHTEHQIGSCYDTMTVEAMQFPLVHPSFMVRHNLADRFTQGTAFDADLLTKACRKITKLNAKLNSDKSKVSSTD
jgi:hypothetical protein